MTGLNAAITLANGGTIGQVLQGAAIGMIAGQLSGGMTQIFGDGVGAQAGIAMFMGGAMSKAQGGKFIDGVKGAAIGMGISYGISRIAMAAEGKAASGGGEIDWGSEGTAEERLQRFEDARGQLAPGDADIKYVDTYKGLTTDLTTGVTEEQWLLNAESAKRFIAETPAGTVRGFMNGYEEKVGGFLGFFKTSKITIYRSGVLGVRNASFSGLTGKYTFSGRDHALFTLGHELGHRSGLDQISNAVGHPNANRHGLALCQGAGGC